MKTSQNLFILCMIIVLFISTGHVSADEKGLVRTLVTSLSVLDPVVYEKLIVFPVK